jgi:hypothetical protein
MKEIKDMSCDEIITEIRYLLRTEFYNDEARKDFKRVLLAADLAPITLLDAIELIILNIEEVL